MVFRVALHCFANRQDAEDAVQEVFLRLYGRQEPFESPEHLRRWLIRVTVNACKDLLRSFFRRNTVPLEEAVNKAVEPYGQAGEVLRAVLSLPEQYRQVVYLHYYEGYTAPEIGKMLGKNPNTVYTLLTRARERLRKTLGGEENGGADSAGL